jgi:transcription elongation factor SPT5
MLLMYQSPIITGTGNLKGDLARIVDIYDGGDRVMIQAVPRPDYKNESQGGRGKSSLTGAKTRPPQRLFDLVELKNAGGESFRKYHPAARTGERYDFWNNEYYKDGFLYKAVNPTTYLTAVNVKPKIEEQKMFLATVKSSKEPEDDEDEEAMAKAQQEEEMISQHSMVKALAESIGMLLIYSTNRIPHIN